jgi:hypothetical protein
MYWGLNAHDLSGSASTIAAISIQLNKHINESEMPPNIRVVDHSVHNSNWLQKTTIENIYPIWERRSPFI